MGSNNLVVVDSSVLVAFYIKADVQHENAVAVLTGVMNSTLLIHPFVIQETATVITYKVGKETANKFLQDIKEADNAIITPLHIDRDSTVFLQTTRKLSFTDVALINLAYRENAQLLTFDEQMIAVAKTFKGIK